MMRPTSGVGRGICRERERKSSRRSTQRYGCDVELEKGRNAISFIARWNSSRFLGKGVLGMTICRMWISEEVLGG